MAYPIEEAFAFIQSQDAYVAAYTRETYSHVIGKFNGFGLTPAADEVIGLFGQMA